MSAIGGGLGGLAGWLHTALRHGLGSWEGTGLYLCDARGEGGSQGEARQCTYILPGGEASRWTERTCGRRCRASWLLREGRELGCDAFAVHQRKSHKGNVPCGRLSVAVACTYEGQKEEHWAYIADVRMGGSSQEPVGSASASLFV